MIHIISNHSYKIRVNSVGAELISLEKNNINYLWTKTPPFWQRHAPVLFPIVGKLRENKYLFKNKEYSLTQHGFARDSQFELVESNNASLKFRLKENKNPNFPFQYEFFITYQLHSAGLKTIYSVENKGNSTLPFSVGAHPGFLCPFFEEEKLEDYYFEFEQEEKLNRTLLLNGLRSSQIQTTELKNKKIYLSEALFIDDALVLSDFKSKWVALKSKNYCLTVSWENCNYLGLWKQPKAPFVCIEPWWGVTDSVDHNQNLLEKEGINLLAPGTSREFWFDINIGSV